jgi:hypothetical protein
MLVTLRFAEELLAPKDLDLSAGSLKAGNLRCRPPIVETRLIGL